MMRIALLALVVFGVPSSSAAGLCETSHIVSVRGTGVEVCDAFKTTATAKERTEYCMQSFGGQGALTSAQAGRCLMSAHREVQPSVEAAWPVCRQVADFRLCVSEDGTVTQRKQ